MSDDRSSDEVDEAPSRSDDDERPKPNGFTLEAGLRPLKDFLGNLVEITATDTPPPTEAPIDRSSADEQARGRPADVSRRTAEPDRTNRPRKKRRRSPSGEYLVDTRREDGEFVVTADIPGASRDDLSVGIDPRTNELVIGASGTVLERVDPPWRSVEATNVWFNNGILEVRLRPDEP